MRFVFGFILAALVAGCSTAPIKLPSNVSTASGAYGATYLDTIDFSYKAPPPAFAKLKLCVAENVSNDAVTLHDSSGSFVGPLTGQYYQANHSQSVDGGGIFKYADPATGTVIATGTADGGSVAWGITRDVIKYNLKAAVASDGATLIFSNIKQAQQDTGAAANDGFHPAGAWKGAHPRKVYASLERIARKIKACAE